MRRVEPLARTARFERVLASRRRFDFPVEAPGHRPAPVPIFGALQNRARAAPASIALEQSFQVAWDHWRHQDLPAAARGSGSWL